jgi:crossover junction endodeoxyribonuclease RuvC
VRVVSFDLSLTATGWCVSDTAVEWGVFNPPAKMRDIPRIDWVAKQCAQWARSADLVVMEDFAFAASMSFAREIAGLSYMVRHWLWKHQKPYVLVAPTSVKKMATGKGNADKSLVMKSVFQRWAHDCDNDNSADAVTLCYIGRSLVGEWPSTTDPQREVIALLGVRLLSRKSTCLCTAGGPGMLPPRMAEGGHRRASRFSRGAERADHPRCGWHQGGWRLRWQARCAP